MDVKSLSIEAHDFNTIVKKPGFIKKLRKLTLSPYSGMNYELTNLERLFRFRKVKCRILTVNFEKKLIAWALLSKEDTDFSFAATGKGFNAFYDGTLFEIYVKPEFRRQGIGSELIKIARRKVSGGKLSICPWDDISFKFYNNFKNHRAKEL